MGSRARGSRLDVRMLEQRSGSIPHRYQRQALFAPIGEAGQQRLLESRVVIVGCGATGSVIATYLARAGVGRLLVVDRDFVERTNLQRQLLYTDRDVDEAMPKAAAAERALRAINPEIEVQGLVADLHAGNILPLLDEASLVMDGTDNFGTRYLINDACVRQVTPWIYTGAVASHGMTMTIRPGQSACFRCVFPEPAPPGTAATCDTAGVLGPAVGMVASLAAAEAIKLLVGDTAHLNPGLIHLDAWHLQFQTVTVARRVGEKPCSCCVERQFPFLAEEPTGQTTSLCGRNAVQITGRPGTSVSLPRLAERLQALGPVQVNRFLLRFAVDGCELTVFPDGRAIIQGTTDPAVARGLYARYVGS
jgi:molybdopterin-synthase adenylyltransferase